MQNKDINLFSRTGLTILGVITVPIFFVVIVGSYFPDLQKSIAQNLGSTDESVSTKAKQLETSTPEDSNRTLISTHQLGFNLWGKDNCVIAQGVTTDHLNQMRMNIQTFKNKIKQEYSVKCVLLE